MSKTEGNCFCGSRARLKRGKFSVDPILEKKTPWKCKLEELCLHLSGGDGGLGSLMWTEEEEGCQDF